jgi:hypothetical protein
MHTDALHNLAELLNQRLLPSLAGLSAQGWREKFVRLPRRREDIIKTYRNEVGRDGVDCIEMAEMQKLPNTLHCLWDNKICVLFAYPPQHRTSKPHVAAQRRSD